jgi:hypothetical protein
MSETYKNRKEYIDYIIAEATKAFPEADWNKLRPRMISFSEDDIYRLANAIERFGIEGIVELVKNSI